MALSLLQRAQLRTNGEFLSRVREAIAIAAGDVLNEGKQTAKHDARVRWAKKAIRDPQAEAMHFLPGLMRHNQIVVSGADAKDDEIQAAVNSLIDLYGADEE